MRKTPDPDPELEEALARRRRLRALGAAAAVVAAVVGVIALILWKSAAPRTFFLRDARTGAVVSDPTFTVVLDARRRPGAPFISSATRVLPDVFGRFQPAPETPGEISEFYVWHIAYRPVVRGQPKDGVILLEPHGGSPSPD
ncbi:MAG TPA: hypothetical protein VHF22_09700, partial [Planctomycetota bacterium]|nr:hypothetical protein [Planctomycetota bacterium]